MSAINFKALLSTKYISQSRIQNYKRYIKILSNYLNKIHGKNYSLKYWEIIIGPWLISFIYLLDYRYKNINNKKFNNKINYIVTPYDYTAFSWFINIESDYNKSLDNLIIKFLISENYNKKIIFKKIFLKENILKLGLKYIFSKIINLSLYFSKIAMISPYFSWYYQLKIIFISKFKIFPIYFIDTSRLLNFQFLVPTARGWFRKRNKFQDPLDRLLYRIILKQIPYIYLEGYKSNLKAIPDIRKNVQIIYSAVAYQENEKAKLFSAESFEKNSTKIFGGQHGGSPYGTTPHPFAYHESELLDKYFTWGWKKSKNHIPLGSIKFSMQKSKVIRSRNKSSKEDFLFISDAGQIHWPDGTGIPSGNQWNTYYEDQIKFFKELDDLSFSKILYRIHPYHNLYPFRKTRKISKLNIKFDKNQKILESLRSAELVICDNLKSTFYEMILYDIPVILILNEKLWKYDKKFKMHILRMKKAKMYHSSTKSAVKFLVKNSSKFDSWWNSIEVKNIRKDLTKNYVRHLESPEEKLSIALTDFLN